MELTSGTEGPELGGAKRKWFQVTNFTARSPTGMLRSELGSRDDGTILLLLLTTGIARLPIKRSRSRLHDSSRPEPTTRNGFSLTYQGCSLPNHRDRVKVPSLLLRYHSDLSD
jgi:hypothetical protein